MQFDTPPGSSNSPPPAGESSATPGGEGQGVFIKQEPMDTDNYSHPPHVAAVEEILSSYDAKCTVMVDRGKRKVESKALKVFGKTFKDSYYIDGRIYQYDINTTHFFESIAAVKIADVGRRRDLCDNYTLKSTEPTTGYFEFSDPLPPDEPGEWTHSYGSMKNGDLLKEAGYEMMFLPKPTPQQVEQLISFSRHDLYTNLAEIRTEDEILQFWRKKFSSKSITVCIAKPDLSSIAAAACCHIMRFTTGKKCVVIKTVVSNAEVLYTDKGEERKCGGLGDEILRMVKQLAGDGGVVFAYCVLDGPGGRWWRTNGCEFTKQPAAHYISVQLGVNLKSDDLSVDWDCEPRCVVVT